MFYFNFSSKKSFSFENIQLLKRDFATLWAERCNKKEIFFDWFQCLSKKKSIKFNANAMTGPL